LAIPHEKKPSERAKDLMEEALSIVAVCLLRADEDIDDDRMASSDPPRREEVV